MKKIFKWVMSIGVVATSMATVISCSSSAAKDNLKENKNHNILNNAFENFNTYDYQKLLAGDTTKWHNDTNTLDLDLGSIFHLSKQTPLVGGTINMDPINNLFRRNKWLSGDQTVNNILESYISTPYLTYSFFEKARDGNPLTTPGLYHIQPDKPSSLLSASGSQQYAWNNKFLGTGNTKDERALKSISLFNDSTKTIGNIHNGIMAKYMGKDLEVDYNHDGDATGNWMNIFGPIDQKSWTQKNDWVSGEDCKKFNIYSSISTMEDYTGLKMDAHHFAFRYYKYASNYKFKEVIADTSDLEDMVVPEIEEVNADKNKPLAHPGFYIFPPNNTDGSISINKTDNVGYVKIEDENQDDAAEKISQIFSLSAEENSLPASWNNNKSRVKISNINNNSVLSLDLSQANANITAKRIYKIDLSNNYAPAKLNTHTQNFKADLSVSVMRQPALMFFDNTDYSMKVAKNGDKVEATVPNNSLMDICSTDFLQYVEVANLRARDFPRNFMHSFAPSSIYVGDKTLYYQDHFGGHYSRNGGGTKPSLPAHVIRSDSFKTTTVEGIYITDKKFILSEGSFGSFDGFIERTLINKNNPNAILWDDKITYHHNSTTYKYYAKYGSANGSPIEFSLRGFFKTRPADREAALNAITYGRDSAGQPGTNGDAAFSSNFTNWKSPVDNRLYNCPVDITDDWFELDFIAAQSFKAGNGYQAHTLPTFDKQSGRRIYQESKGFTTSPEIIYDEGRAGKLNSYISQFADSLEYKNGNSDVHYYHKSFFDLDESGSDLNKDNTDKLKYALPKPLIGFYKEGTKLSYQDYLTAYNSGKIDEYILNHLKGDDVSRVIIPGDYSGSDFRATNDNKEPVFFKYRGHIIPNSSVQNMILHTRWSLSLIEGKSAHAKTVPSWTHDLPQADQNSINATPTINSPTSHEIVNGSKGAAILFSRFSQKIIGLSWPTELETFKLQFKFGDINLGDAIDMEKRKIGQFLFDLSMHKMDILVMSNFWKNISIFENEDFDIAGADSISIILGKPTPDSEHTVGYLLAQELRKFLHEDAINGRGE